MDFINVCLQEYGDIEYCVILKNKTTGESKGLGYVRYYKPSQAALAIENCDKSKDMLFPSHFCRKLTNLGVSVFLRGNGNLQLSNVGVYSLPSHPG